MFSVDYIVNNIKIIILLVLTFLNWSDSQSDDMGMDGMVLWEQIVQLYVTIV